MKTEKEERLVGDGCKIGVTVIRNGKRDRSESPEIDCFLDDFHEVLTNHILNSPRVTKEESDAGMPLVGEAMERVFCKRALELGLEVDEMIDDMIGDMFKKITVSGG